MAQDQPRRKYDGGIQLLVLQAFVCITCHGRPVFFTTKITKDTKGWTVNTPTFVLFVSFVVKTISQQTRKNPLFRVL